MPPVASDPVPEQDQNDGGGGHGGSVILQGQGDEIVNYESEAGPRAMAVAGHMMEDVMEDFVETLRDIVSGSVGVVFVLPGAH